jgi:hypothetical protein
VREERRTDHRGEPPERGAHRRLRETKQLAARGAKVVLAARRKAELDAVAANIGQNAFAVVTDVTKRSDVEHQRCPRAKVRLKLAAVQVAPRPLLVVIVQPARLLALWTRPRLALACSA